MKNIFVLIIMFFSLNIYSQTIEIEAKQSVVSYRVAKLAKLAGYKDLESNYYYDNGKISYYAAMKYIHNKN